MMRDKRTAIGIDICEGWIRMALVCRDERGVRLLKTVSAEVPVGTVKNGNIEDPGLLGKAVRKLKNSNKMRANRAAMSLVANPTVIQTVEMPKQIPVNIGQFVRNQVKQYAVLPAKELAVDFCGCLQLTGGESTAAQGSTLASNARVLVAATESRKTEAIAKACSKAGLDLEVIEPPLLAYIRALYRRMVAAKSDRNVLLITLRDQTLTLCVFVKQAVDFISTEQLRTQQPDQKYLLEVLAEQISSVIQFYDLEVAGSSKNWEATVIVDKRDKLPQDAEEYLTEHAHCEKIHIRDNQNAFQDTPLAFASVSSPGDKEQLPSVVAVGLAMGLLETAGSQPCVNLLPPHVAQKRSLKRSALVAANVMAVLLAVMVAVGTVPSIMAGRIKNEAIRENAQMTENTVALVRQRRSIQKQIQTVSSEIQQLKKTVSSHHEIDWLGLLNEIRNIIPKSVRITRLSCDSSLKMKLEGLALSNEDAYLFADLLDRSGYTTGASISTEKDDEQPELVNYRISCSLAEKKEQ